MHERNNHMDDISVVSLLANQTRTELAEGGGGRLSPHQQVFLSKADSWEKLKVRHRKSIAWVSKIPLKSRSHQRVQIFAILAKG